MMRFPVTYPEATPMAAPPMADMICQASVGGWPGVDPAFRSSEIATVLSAITDPTDKSIPPEMMMIVIPSAAVPTKANWDKREQKQVVSAGLMSNVPDGFRGDQPLTSADLTQAFTALSASTGTPAVTVGTRQHGREHGSNLVMVDHDRDAIADAIREQIAHGPYERSQLFGDGRAGARIAEKLAAVRPQVQKRLLLPTEGVRLL